MPHRVWYATSIAWGTTGCEAPYCAAPAEVLTDAQEWGLYGVPYCLEHADALFERQAALSLAADAGFRLDDYPALFEEVDR